MRCTDITHLRTPPISAKDPKKPSFDWYLRIQDIEEKIENYLKPNSIVLDVGCGLSSRYEYNFTSCV